MLNKLRKIFPFIKIHFEIFNRNGIKENRYYFNNYKIFDEAPDKYYEVNYDWPYNYHWREINEMLLWDTLFSIYDNITI